MCTAIIFLLFTIVCTNPTHNCVAYIALRRTFYTEITVTYLADGCAMWTIAYTTIRVIIVTTTIHITFIANHGVT